jgi:hypothetical protein
MPAGKFNDLRDLCFRDLIGEHAANTHTVPVDMKHNLHGLLPRLIEKALQNVNDEFHGRIVVVQEENAVQARLLCLLPRFCDDAGPRAVALARSVVPFVAHWMRIIHMEARLSLA